MSNQLQERNGIGRIRQGSLWQNKKIEGNVRYYGNECVMSPYSKAFFIYSFSADDSPIGCYARRCSAQYPSRLSCLMRTGYRNNEDLVWENAISLFDVLRDKQHMCVSWLGLVSSIFTFLCCRSAETAQTRKMSEGRRKEDRSRGRGGISRRDWISLSLMSTVDKSRMQEAMPDGQVLGKMQVNVENSRSQRQGSQ